MTRPSEDDRAAVDRAFAELVAGYHLTADRPEVVERPAEPDPHWADKHPLFHLPAESPPEVAKPAEPAAEPRYVPEPLPPLPPPAVPALLGWVGIGWAALVVLAAAFGARFPAWVGWVAVVGFIGGFALLVLRLPKSRPPDAGDGAVL